MTDKTEVLETSPVEAPKKRGWPRGKPRIRQTAVEREPARTTIKAKPKFVYTDDEDDDRLKIPKDIIEDMERQGISLQWVTESIFGQPQPQSRARFERKGWEPVHADDFCGKFGDLFMQKGYQGEVNVEGLVLMQRPLEFTQRARAREAQKAREQVQVKEQQMRGGDLPVSGAFDPQHPSALRTNKINKGYERIDVPKE